MHHTNLHARRAAAALVCALLLAACGKSGNSGGDASSPPSRDAGASASPGATSAAASSARLPTADANVPIADYYELEGAHQLAALYYALSELPPDMETLARIGSRDYALATDAFRKQDLLKALAPRLKAEIEHARTHRYFRADYRGVCLGHYDMATRTFPVSGGPTGDSYLYFNEGSEFRLEFTNGDDYRRLAVADEQRARDLEARVTQGAACGNLRVHVFAQGTDLRSKTVRSQIVKAQLFDYQQRPVADL